MDILLGTALGTLIAFILAIPAIFLETSRRVKDLPLLIDVHAWRGRKLKEGEVFAVGLLIHLIVGALYGLLYTLFAEQGWLIVTNAPFTIHSMLIFAFFSWLVLNLVLLPLVVGVGLFGRKEGGTVWLETLVVLLLEGAVLWIIIQAYQPFYFMNV